MERENIFLRKRNLKETSKKFRRNFKENMEREILAANADNVSNTVAISTSSEALVGCAVACAHVVTLVPDLSLAGGIRHWPMFIVPIMVVPRPDFKLRSAVGLEEHCLRSKWATSPLDDVAPQSSFSEVVSTLRRGNVC